MPMPPEPTPTDLLEGPLGDEADKAPPTAGRAGAAQTASTASEVTTSTNLKLEGLK